MASGSRFRFTTSLSKRELDEPLYAPEGCYLGAGPDAPVSVCISENPNFQNWRETGLPPILPGADRPWWGDASLQVGPQPSLADFLYDILIGVDSRLYHLWGFIRESCPKLHWVYGDIYMTMNGVTGNWWPMFRRVREEAFPGYNGNVEMANGPNA